MNPSDYQPLNKEIGELLLLIILNVKRDGEPDLDKFIEETKDEFSIQILHRRIVGFTLPRFEPSAYMFLATLCETPGQVVMTLIDTLNKYDEIKPEKIDVHFIAQHVYPYGFYTKEACEKHYDAHRRTQPDKYDYLYL